MGSDPDYRVQRVAMGGGVLVISLDGGTIFVGAQPVVLAAADTVNPRIDLVGLGHLGAMTVTGTPSACPAPPQPPVGFLELAKVRVQPCSPQVCHRDLVPYSSSVMS